MAKSLKEIIGNSDCNLSIQFESSLRWCRHSETIASCWHAVNTSFQIIWLTGTKSGDCVPEYGQLGTLGLSMWIVGMAEGVFVPCPGTSVELGPLPSRVWALSRMRLPSVATKTELKRCASANTVLAKVEGGAYRGPLILCWRCRGLHLSPVVTHTDVCPPHLSLMPS